jgi:hypothetical protein
MAKSITTCQICGRAIKTRPNARLGAALIAPHGYAVPWSKVGDHARTTPCRGSNHLPYELSCDAIQPMINSFEEHVQRLLRLQHEHLTAPPAELVERRGVGWDRREVRAPRPEGFDPANVPPFGTYAKMYVSRSAQYERDLAAFRASVVALIGRRNSWRLIAA